MSEKIKELNFIKQVERTAKRDAYLAAVRLMKQFGLETGIEFLKRKADGHTEFLNELPLVYDYATQTLVAKEIGIDGVKVHEAMESLAGYLDAEITPPAPEHER